MTTRSTALALALFVGPVLSACGRAPAPDDSLATPPPLLATPTASAPSPPPPPPPPARESPTAAPSPAAGGGAGNTGDDWLVNPRGAGPVRIGMTLAELRAALDGGLDRLGPPGECEYVVPKGAPKGLAVMVVDGRVVRLDVARGSAISTSVGVRSGDSEERVKQRLGPATAVTPHKYVDGGHYLSAPTGVGETWWVVETDGRAATDVRVGVMPQVRWIEGCS